MDKDGIPVICSKECWEDHILDGHPEMEGCETHVKATIENPYQIYQDAFDIKVKVIYKPFILPKPFNQQYLRVAIKYSRKKFKRPRGYVLTAFPCINIKKGDILIWTAL